MYLIAADSAGHQGAFAASTSAGRSWAAWDPEYTAERLEHLIADHIAGGQGDYNNCIGVSPANPSVVALGWQNGTFLSTDGGRHFAGTSGGAHLHADVHAVYFDPRDHNGSTLHVGSDGGIATTTDLATTWSSERSKTLRNLQPTGFPERNNYGATFPHPTVAGAVAAGWKDNGTGALRVDGRMGQGPRRRGRRRGGSVPRRRRVVVLLCRLGRRGRSRGPRQLGCDRRHLVGVGHARGASTPTALGSTAWTTRSSHRWRPRRSCIRASPTARSCAPSAASVSSRTSSTGCSTTPTSLPPNGGATGPARLRRRPPRGLIGSPPTGTPCTSAARRPPRSCASTRLSSTVTALADPVTAAGLPAGSTATVTHLELAAAGLFAVVLGGPTSALLLMTSPPGGSWTRIGTRPPPPGVTGAVPFPSAVIYWPRNDPWNSIFVATQQHRSQVERQWGHAVRCLRRPPLRCPTAPTFALSGTRMGA